MHFEVNGITFNKSDLKTINIDKLKVGQISRGHLFFIPPRGRSVFLVLRAGDYIDDEFIEKFKTKEMTSLYTLPIATKEETEFYQALFHQLKCAHHEQERLIVSQKIIRKYATDYWQLSDSSYLNFSLTCFETFYKFPQEVVTNFQNTSLTMYSRSMMTASVAVMNCLIHQIVDFNFISDIYNMVFVLDYGLVTGGELSYSILKACEEERNKPGKGMRYLEKNHRDEFEIETFKNHPILSARYVDKYKYLFVYPEILEAIRYHHENSDGSGFPGGYSYSGLSDFETFLIFCDVYVPFREHIFLKKDGCELIKNQFERLKEKNEVFNLPINKIISKWDGIMEWAMKDSTDKEIPKDEVA